MDTAPADTAAQEPKADDPDRLVDGFVIAAQDEITISLTECGDIIIEQHHAVANEPAVIVVREGSVDRFIEFLCDLAGGRTLERSATPFEIEVPPIAAAPRRDRTAAERMRRYRARRNAAARHPMNGRSPDAPSAEASHKQSQTP